MTYTLDVDGGVGAALGVEAAVFFPGDALEGADLGLGTLCAVRGTFDLLW